MSNEEQTMVKSELEMMRSALNFSTSGSTDDYDPPTKKSRQARDPMSHRIIEKRRRDRMNNCLADLSQLIPQHYMKQGQGRIEKTEIIEMAISHIQHIKQLYMNSVQVIESGNRDLAERFWLGYKEAMDEVMRFLVEKQNYSPTHKLCLELQNHLQAQSQQYKPVGSSTEKAKPQRQMMIESQISSGIGSMASDTSSTDSSNQAKSDTPLRENMDTLAKNVTVSKSGDMTLSRSSGRTSFTDIESLSSNSGSLSGAGNQPSHANAELSSPTQGYVERNDSDTSKQGAGYNFKKYIKLRFTKGTSSKTDQDIAPSDNVSVSSYEDSDYQDLKKKKLHNPGPTSDSTSSPYPASEYSSNSGNGSNENTGGESSTSSPKAQNRSRHWTRQSPGSLSEEEENSAQEEVSNVPGFALHPSGNYYIPIVINTEDLLPYLKKYDNMPNAMSICHPVSIPVNFGGGHFMSYQVLGQRDNGLHGKATIRKTAPSRTNQSRSSSHSSRTHKSSNSEEC